MEANPSKLEWILFKGNKEVSDFKVFFEINDICIDDTLTFTLNDIYLKGNFIQAGLVSLNAKKPRTLRIVLKDSVSDYESLLSKSGVDSFRLSSIKIWQ